MSIKEITITTDYGGNDIDVTTVEIREDSDQPGWYLWFNEETNEGSSISFDSVEAAERDFYLTFIGSLT